MRTKSRKNKKILIKQAITEKGITLIALVVTIVVLLILAGVTITMVLGEDGIIAQAKLAAEKTKDAEEKQEQDLKNLVEEMDKILNDEGSVETTPTETPTPKLPTIKEAREKEFAESENKEITDGNKKMWVPQGYIVVDPNINENVKYEDKDNPKIDEGIVITDAVDETGKSTGNEFVWVPVPDPNEMYGIDNNNSEYYLGKLYDFETSGPTPKGWENAIDGKIQWSNETHYHEPDIVTYYSSSDQKEDNLNKVVEGDQKTIDNFKKQLQEEFKAMIESVKKYGGFYIGRYETSGLNGGTPAVKAKVVPTVETDWYTMYKNIKKIAKAESGAISSMIWGSQWDRVMNWFLSDSDPSIKYYVKNGEGMGWYSSNKDMNSTHQTGKDLLSNEKVMNRVKNIYDMGGNMEEWTIEEHDNTSRSVRGGDFNGSGVNYPPYYRTGELPYIKNNNQLSSRVTLYVK